MWTISTPFAKPGDKLTLEEGAVFTPKFNADGLIAAMAVDDSSGDILMLAWMNAEALSRTLSSGDVWYYSRSRDALWRKGETSGHTQRLVSMHTDCDQDALILRIQQIGPACHTNRRSCFYRTVEMGPDGPVLRTALP